MGVQRGSVLGPLLFPIYITDLPQGLHTEGILFADDTSLFSVDDNNDESAYKLNNHLINVQDWPYKRKMSFNREKKNQPRKLYSLEKLKMLLNLNSILTVA